MKGFALPVVVLAFAVAFGAGQASGVPDPCTLTLSLTPGERTAEITDVSPDSVTFTGEWTLTKPPGLDGAVTFTAANSQGWVAWVSPNSVNLGVENERTGNFTLTVVVPAGTRATSIGLLNVTGRLVVGSEVCAQAEASGVVSPDIYFGGIYMESRTDVVTVDGAGLGHVNLRVWSTANFEVGSLGELELEGPPGLVFENPGLLPPAKENGTVYETNVTIMVDASRLPAGSYHLSLVLWQACPYVCHGIDVFTNVEITLVVPERGLGPPAIAAIAGASVATAAAVFFWKRRGSA